jgi:hypothetical protein
MSNSPYQDALSLLKEIHNDIESLSRVSLVCPESIHDELRKFRDDLGKRIKKVDNSQAQPVRPVRAKYQGTYKGTFE